MFAEIAVASEDATTGGMMTEKDASRDGGTMIRLADESTRTMRIELKPDELGESLARKKRESGLLQPCEERTTVDSSVRGDRTSDYRKLLQSIYDAVLITDEEGRIHDFNSRALDFFMCSEEGLTGTRIVRLISGADISLLDAIRRNLKNHKYTLIEARCRRRDRSVFPAEIAVNKIELDEGVRLCFFVRDISVRKKAQEELERAIVRLEEHDRARSQFVSNVSHELRTPLTSMIYAVANMLRGVVGPLPDRVRRYLEMLEGDSKRLLATVNDILDLRKIENRSLTLNRVRATFAHIVRSSVRSLRVQIQQKSIELNMDIDSDHWFVNCDPQKMERVVLNIVGNALKFTPQGGRVDVLLKDDPQKPGNVLLVVEDTGAGIPADAVDKVTLRYFTVGEQPSGSGLGLAISKEIVDLHGGHLLIKSPPHGAEQGTGVYVSLPTVDPPLIVVVEPDRQSRQALGFLLTEHGYRVQTTEGGAQVLDLLKSEHPDTIVTELIGEDLSGGELISRIKADPDACRIPVLVVTGGSVDSDISDMLRTFSIPRLSKPYNDNVLLEEVAKALVSKATMAQRPLLRVTAPPARSRNTKGAKRSSEV